MTKRKKQPTRTVVVTRDVSIPVGPAVVRESMAGPVVRSLRWNRDCEQCGQSFLPVQRAGAPPARVCPACMCQPSSARPLK